MAKVCAAPVNAATTGCRFRDTALATLCVDGVAEGLAGLERGHPAGGDCDSLGGL